MLKNNKTQGYINKIAEDTGGMFAIPRWLFTEQRYQSLSMDARIVYAMLIYRRNPAMLKSGYAVIGEKLQIEDTMAASVDAVRNMLLCNKNTAKKVIAQLVDSGLVSAELTQEE